MNLGKLLEQVKDDDLLLITADHGNDPTYTGTDHTREQAPLLAYSPSMKESGLQETKDTFAVIGASVAENFGVKMPEGTIGTSNRGNKEAMAFSAEAVRTFRKFHKLSFFEQLL